jgi:MFS superfamily sulfate permease-like transporter
LQTNLSKKQQHAHCQIKTGAKRMIKHIAQVLEPNFFVYFKKYGYSKNDFYKDLLASLSVAIVALPLSLAIAIASNLPPERGLFTAIIAGFLISFFGGSRLQVGGPFFFGIVENFIDTFSNQEDSKKVFILRLRYVTLIDAAGVHAIEVVYDNCKRKVPI